MSFNWQISNWLLATLGGLASWLVILACAMLALTVFYRVRLLHARGESLGWLLDRTLVIRFLCLLFFIWVLMGFNSNAPKVVLAPDYSAEQVAREALLKAEAAPVKNLAPHRDSAEETSEQLESLREEEKESVLGE